MGFDLGRVRFYYARPLAVSGMPVPASITVSSAVSRGATYSGPLPVERLADVTAAGISLLAAPEVSLRFSRERGHATVHLNVSAACELRCERCEATYAWPLALAPALRLVDSDAAEQASLADADPVRVEDDELVPARVVEQEILLNLPVVSRCPACEAALAEEEPESAQAPTHRPFAALLKRS